MATRRFLTRPGLLLATGAVLAGAVTGVFLLTSVLSSKAQRPDLQQNADFLKRGRPDIALCVSDYTTSPANQADLVSRLKNATADNKASLWKDTFLASERLRVESPCPAGPRVSETTTMFESIFDLPVVEKPGPYVLYVFIADAPLLSTLDRLNLARISPQEYVDPDPGQPGGYEQVAAALYLSREEFGRPDFVARQVAEALGCTEGCSGAAPQPQQETPGAPESP